MKIAKIYLSDSFFIKIRENTLINDEPIDLKCPESQLRQLITDNSCIQIETNKYKYFLVPSKIVCIKFFKTK